MAAVPDEGAHDGRPLDGATPPSGAAEGPGLPPAPQEAHFVAAQARIAALSAETRARARQARAATAARTSGPTVTSSAATTPTSAPPYVGMPPVTAQATYRGGATAHPTGDAAGAATGGARASTGPQEGAQAPTVVDAAASIPRTLTGLAATAPTTANGSADGPRARASTHGPASAGRAGTGGGRLVAVTLIATAGARPEGAQDGTEHGARATVV